MEHVLSIDGLDTNILSHLTFRELGNLRKVSTSLSSVVNILSINISKDLIEHFKNYMNYLIHSLNLIHSKNPNT